MKKNISYFSVLFFLVSVFIISTVSAETLETTTRRITSSPAYETTPTIGHNDVTNTDYVVYTLKPSLGGGLLGPGDIWFQPLFNGAPSGLPVQVTNSSTDDQLNDCSGDWIVYTAYDSTASAAGSIVVYQISTKETHTIATASIIQEPKIHGDRVVWREGGAFATTIKYYELGWIPHGNTPRTLAGPIPPTFDVQIGSRFAVWAELANMDMNVYAYDFEMMAELQITDTPDINERDPATSGGWIVWEQDSSTIEAMNMDTMERITIDNGGGNYNPSIDGDIIAWTSNVDGNLDIWIYRISTGDSYQVLTLPTSEPHDQYLNDIFGDMVAYVDMSGGSEDVYLSYWGEIRTPGYQPSGITYDGTYLYVSEMSGFRKISKLWPNNGAFVGLDLEFLAPSPTGFDGLGNPNGLAYDGSGHLFVSDLGSNGIGVLYEIDTAGTTIINTFPLPFRGGGVAFDGTNIYVSDFNSETILVMDREGKTVNEFNSPIRPAGMTYDASTGHLLVISEFDDQISKITTDGQLVCSVAGPRDPGIQGLGGITIVESELYIAEVTDPDPFNPPEISGTIYRVPIPNCPPIADAGIDQTVHPVTTVNLDGSGSTDPEGNYPLTFIWELEKPDGSGAELSDPTSVSPAFTVDVIGNYIVQLVVTDSGGAQSQPDEVVISTFNTAPVADAGEDQSIVLINTLVLLDGTQSYDYDGDEITYSWLLKSKPEGSLAELNDKHLPEPTFTADLFGDYVIELIVSDPWTSSAADEVLVSFDNVPPVAVAGGSQSVLVGETIYLDGRDSFDVNGDPLSYSWSMVTKPDGSSSVLSDLTTEQTSFVTDTQGSYVISLVVNDGLVDSDADNVSILATPGQGELEGLLRDDAVEMINSLDPDVFKNKNMQKTLVNKINAVLNQINKGFYQEALDKLENDIIGKMDGCAATGSPDKNDMIQDCAAQQQVYPIIVAAIELLKDMI